MKLQSRALFALALIAACTTTLAGKPTDDADFSSGRAVTVSPSMRIEYLPASRVWYDQAGDLMVCRHPASPTSSYGKVCELPGVKGERAGWKYLKETTTPGSTLRAVQVNETKNGLSLVLYWASQALPAN